MEWDGGMEKLGEIVSSIEEREVGQRTGKVV